MNAVGIVAEYNPLHNGHIYHIEEARKIAGSDAVVVAMSGNYVQRGEPAILDKWERTRLALLHGADLVVEIPTLFCLGNAAQYAKAGVTLLESVPSVKTLAFGSESGIVDDLVCAASNLDKASAEIESMVSGLIKDGITYPAARAEAYKTLFPDAGELPAESNDILALEYVRNIKRLEPVAIKRRGAAYNDCACDDVFMSASGIRKATQSDMPISQYAPFETTLSLEDSITTYPDNWLNTLKYAVMSITAEEIDNCPSGGEGLGNRIKSSIGNARSWDELVETVKSKRYTHTRISRLFMQIILGINRDDYTSDIPGYMRVLGMNDKGRGILSELRDGGECDLPILTNINKQADGLDEVATKQLELDIHGSDIYNLVTGRDEITYSDYRMKPIIISL